MAPPFVMASSSSFLGSHDRGATLPINSGMPQNPFSSPTIVGSGLTRTLLSLGMQESTLAPGGDLFDELADPTVFGRDRSGDQIGAAGTVPQDGGTDARDLSSMNSGLLGAEVPGLGGARSGVDLVRTPGMPSIFSAQGPGLFRSNGEASLTSAPPTGEIPFLRPLEHTHVPVGGLSMPPLPSVIGAAASLPEAESESEVSADAARKKPRL
jgi:hypothetical protein